MATMLPILPCLINAVAFLRAAAATGDTNDRSGCDHDGDLVSLLQSPGHAASAASAMSTAMQDPHFKPQTQQLFKVALDIGAQQHPATAATIATPAPCSPDPASALQMQRLNVVSLHVAGTTGVLSWLLPLSIGLGLAAFLTCLFCFSEAYWPSCKSAADAFLLSEGPNSSSNLCSPGGTQKSVGHSLRQHPTQVLAQPLVPTLLLPSSETRVGIDVNKLTNAKPDESVELLSVSGKPFMILTIREANAEHGGKIEIALPNRPLATKCTIVLPLQSGTQSTRVTAKILDSNGALHGELCPEAEGIDVLYATSVMVPSKQNGQSLFVIEAARQPHTFAIHDRLHNAVAKVRMNSSDFPTSDFMEICVFPGVDAVLVTACVLTLIVFQK
jgi:hypothetical protein